MSEFEKVLCFSCLNALDDHYAPTEMESLRTLFPSSLGLKRVFTLFRFSQTSVIQRLLHLLKYEGKEEVGWWMGSYLAKRLPQSIKDKVVLLVPVPMHSSKERVRGYNQVRAIAKGLVSSIPSWEIEDNALRRHKGETSLTTLTRTERREETNRLYYLENPELLTGKHIMLLDDVLTTGATLIACAQLIQSANVQSLFITAVAEADK